jgi:hypothetical protein
MGEWVGGLLDKSAIHMTLGVHVGDTWELCVSSSWLVQLVPLLPAVHKFSGLYLGCKEDVIKYVANFIARNRSPKSFSCFCCGQFLLLGGKKKFKKNNVLSKSSFSKSNKKLFLPIFLFLQKFKKLFFWIFFLFSKKIQFFFFLK